MSAGVASAGASFTTACTLERGALEVATADRVDAAHDDERARREVAEEAAPVVELPEGVGPPHGRVARACGRPQLGMERVPMGFERARDQVQPVGEPGEAAVVRERPRHDHEKPQIPALPAQRLGPRQHLGPVDRQHRLRDRIVPLVAHDIDLRLHQPLDLMEPGIVAQALAGRILSVQWTEPWSEIEHGNNPPRVTEQCALHRTDSADAQVSADSGL